MIPTFVKAGVGLSASIHETGYKYTQTAAHELFRQQLDAGWNDHLEADVRLWEAFIHGFLLARSMVDTPSKEPTA